MKPKIIIVAGGLATRMGNLTEKIPKCMIDINGKPLIWHQLLYFKKQGYKNIIFCIAHLANKVKEYFKEGKKLGMNIQYIQETEELRGTAGSVRLAKNLIEDNENFIVYYGDNITNIKLDKLIEYHKERNSLATICMRPLPLNYKSSSIITLKKNSKINIFLEKPTELDIKKYKGQKKYINNGVYIFKKEIFRYIPKDKKYDFSKQLFPFLIKNYLNIFGYPTKEFFREIGRPRKYKQFLQEFKGKNILT